MRIAGRRFSAGLASLVLLAALAMPALAMPALAVVSKSGNQYCSGDWTPYSRSYSTGFTEHYPPGNGYQGFNNGATWMTRMKLAPWGSAGGFWFVQTNGSLNDPGTYAGCSPVN